MLHKMKLNKEPFDEMKNGTKMKKQKVMHKIYSPKKERQYGVIGIKVKVIE